MKNLFFLILSLITTIASAQNCDEASLLKTPGRWKVGMKGSQGGTAAELQKEKKLLEAIHGMITTKYTPMSLEAIYHGAYSPPYPNMPGNSFGYSIIPLRFYCEGNIIKTEHETSSYFSINANFFEAEIYDTVEDKSSLLGFHTVAALPIQKDGYWYFQEKNITLAFGQPGKKAMWLITYDGKLPYSYVTKKEFLEKRKLFLAYAMVEEKKRIEDVLKNNEIGKSYKETEYKNDPAKLAKYMKMDYLSVKERYEKNLSEYKTKYDQAFVKIEKQLQLPANELNQKAIVKMDPLDYLTYLFLDETDGSGNILIKPNPFYFNKKLPRSTPQFFWIYNTGSHVDPVYGKFMTDIMNALDFKLLKSMLGKEAENNLPQPKLASQTKPAPTKTEIKQTSTFDIYKNKPTPGFVSTPVAQIKNAVASPSPVNSAIKHKVLGINLTAATIPAYLNRILADVEKSLDQQQKENTELLYAKLNMKVIDLADAGVMLYYKGAVKEGLWCLAKAASMKPSADYILNNLTGIMNLADAELRALPILRFLKDRHPNNTTILNNLGQALYKMGELNRSEAVLDSCIRIATYHPQANLTKAAIAEKKGKNGESADHIQKSLKGAYTENAHEFARRKGMKLDYGNILNRYRPTSAEYINPRKYQPPPQCTNVFETAMLEAQWDEYNAAISDIISKINGGLRESSERYGQQVQKQLQNPTTTSVFSLGPLHSKAEKLYKIYLDQVAALQEEATFYMEHTYKNDEESIEREHSASMERIEKKYSKMSGEGKGSYAEARCAEINTANNAYLTRIAAIKNAFIGRFAEPLRQLSIEMMYWSQLMSGPTGFREMIYYERALVAVNAMNIKSKFMDPCEAKKKGTADKYETDLPEPFCPITFKFKVAVAKITGDCSKFEIEFDIKGLILNYERDFVHKHSTLAIGAGISAELTEEMVSKNVMEFVDFGGAGVGVKAQGFIEIDANGVSDFGLLGEAAIEGVLTDKGDLKINGKLGVNSGVDISTSEGVQTIGKILNAF